MQTQVNSNIVKNPTQSLDNPGFNQLEQSLSGALKQFEDETSFLSTVTAALRPIGEYSIGAWNFTAGYARRHPLRIATTVVAVGFVAAYLMKRNAGVSQPMSSDGRQY